MSDHGAARHRDVEVVRVLLEEGRELTKEETRRRWGVPERRFRAAVSALRLEGYPVISGSTEGSTYRKAISMTELDSFIDAELVSRTRVLEQQIRELRQSAPRHFGVSEQLALIPQGRR